MKLDMDFSNHYARVEKVFSKEELSSIIGEYQDMLNPEVMNYLYSLLNLEVSALKKGEISDSIIDKLTELKFFRKLVIYNLYTKLFSLFEKESEHYSLKIEGNNAGLEGLRVFYQTYGIQFRIFEMNYSGGAVKLNLSELIHSEEIKKLELERLYRYWDDLEEQTNPFEIRDKIYGGPASFWEMKHDEEICSVVQKIGELSAPSSDVLIKDSISPVMQHFSHLVLQNLEVEDAEFVDDLSLKSKSTLEKRLVRNYPHTTIKRDIKYY